MSDQALRDVYARIMRQRGATGRSGAVSVEQMQAVLERRGSEEERVRTLDTIMRDHDMRADFEILRAAYEAAPSRAMPSIPIGWALAAALVLMVGGGLWMRSRAPVVDTERGSSAGVSVVGPGPTAALGEPLRFTWHRVGDATAYGVQLVDADGSAAYSTTTMDTVAALPETVKLSTDKDYRWWVEARRATGETIKSTVQQLRITR